MKEFTKEEYSCIYYALRELIEQSYDIPDYYKRSEDVEFVCDLKDKVYKKRYKEE